MLVHLVTTRPLAVVAVILGVLLTACSGSGAPQVATLAAGADGGAGTDGAGADVDSEEALLAFAECMREQGVDFADPVAGDDGTLRFGPPGGGEGGGFDPSQREEFEAAREACGDLLDGVAFGGPGGGRGQGEFDSEAFLAFAECMRDNGVEDFPDPSADGRPDIEAMRQLDVQSDAFQEASSTCSDEVGFQGPGAGGGFRGGPGGGGPPPGFGGQG